MNNSNHKLHELKSNIPNTYKNEHTYSYSETVSCYYNFFLFVVQLRKRKTYILQNKQHN